MINPNEIPIEVEREVDGRYLASAPGLPGGMAYGHSDEDAVRRARGIAVEVLADSIDEGSVNR